MPPPWIFAYGSLVWRPDFPNVERRAAYVRGWRRVFWQGSTDHRGVPGAPGRVVTLVRDPQARCGGAAYRLPSRDARRILERLDAREAGGYERHRELLWFPDAVEPGPEALLWVATSGNPNYLGPAPPEAIAAQVRTSHGPSGANPEYVLRLAAALRELGIDDPEVASLEALLASRGA